MDGEKPIIQQMQDNIPSGQDVRENITESAKDIGESLTNMKNDIKESLDDFSKKSAVDASSDFLSSNSLLAKFAFVILVVIVFMVLLRILMSILGYFLSPSRTPYLVRGALGGNDKQVIPQDPSKDEHVQVLKSNDRHRGLEFTWSVWLFLNQTDVSGVKNVFVKGNDAFDSSGVNLLNGPGLYVEQVDVSGAAEYKLHVLMDRNGGDGNTHDTLEVESIPIRKWVHVAIRMQNTVLDVYVNGTIAKRHNMDFAPKQNFNDVVVCGNGGFSGKLSDLRYYSYAMNVFELNNVVMWGPNTTPSELSVDSRAKTGNYSYLSSVWYSNKY